MSERLRSTLVTVRLIVTGAKQGIANSRQSWDRYPLVQRPCRRGAVPLRRAMAARSAAGSGRSSMLSDSTGPLKQCPTGHLICALSSGPSVDLIT
jgi:hypothetical protein